MLNTITPKIADIAFLQKYDTERVKRYQADKPPLSHALADTVFSCTLEFIFLVQSSLMTFIPIAWLAQLLTHAHLAFLYSLYAFEYKWFHMSWHLERRLSFIESRWPYFCGFGLTLSLLLACAGDSFYTATLFAFVFPALILSSIDANCERLQPIVYYKSVAETDGVRPVVLKLPLFRPSLKVTDFIFKLFDKRKRAIGRPWDSSNGANSSGHNSAGHKTN